MKPTLHLIAPFHTVLNAANSHCAFSGKAMRFSAMMQQAGYRCIEYSNGRSESACENKVVLLSEAELPPTGVFQGDTAIIGSPHWKIFDQRLRGELHQNLQPGDIVCHTFGRSHTELVRDFISVYHVETGVGYPDAEFGCHARVYESYAWLHWHAGRSNKRGDDYHFVIPNYYDLNDWEVREEPGEYLLYFGRICEEKGMHVLRDIAGQGIKIKCVGQGDPAPWQCENLEFSPPVTGAARSALLGHAKAVLMPTRYIEPFGGSGVEGMLCFPADVYVKANNVQKAHHNLYSGALLEITAAGVTVRTTPDHPFLTQRGWVKARDLNSQDSLIHATEKSLDSERIGDFARRVSNEGAAIDGNPARPLDFTSKKQGERAALASGWTALLSAIGRPCNTGEVSRNWRSRRFRDAGCAPDFCDETSPVLGYKICEFIDLFSRGDYANRLRIRAGQHEDAGKAAKPDRKFDTRNGKQAWFASEMGNSAETTSGHDDRFGNSLPSGIHRRGRDCLDSKIWKKKPATAASAVQHVARNNALVFSKNTQNEYAAECTKDGKWIFSGYSQGFLHLFGPRLNAPHAVPKVAASFGHQKATDGNSTGVVRLANAEHYFADDLTTAAISGAHDSFYEYAPIQSIRSRPVTNLPVFNLGTASGTYEAEGFVVHNCGTPLIGPNHSAFSETIEHGRNGFRCRTLGDWLAAIRNIESIPRERVARIARDKYSLSACARGYEAVFAQVCDLRGQGWSTLEPRGFSYDLRG